MPTPLLHRALTQRNLREAWARVADNDGAAGVDGVTVDAFATQMHQHLRAYPGAILGGRYQAAPLRECRIAKIDADGHTKGTRQLAIPTVADRWLQTAVGLVLTPLLEAHFEDVSYAYRRGRSVQQALRRVTQLRDEGYCWVVDADIERFFDHIPHGPLIGQLARVLYGEPAVADGTTARLADAERRLLLLIRAWLDAPLLGLDGQLHRRRQGAPQGSPLSPLLANLYLDQLDDALLDQDHRLVRFADDFLVLCRTRQSAEQALDLTRDVLESLALRLNSEKTRIVDFNAGFRFLGVNFVRTLAIARERQGQPGGRAAVESAPPDPATDWTARTAALTPAPLLPTAPPDRPPPGNRPFWADAPPESALQEALRHSGLRDAELPPAPPADALDPAAPPGSAPVAPTDPLAPGLRNAPAAGTANLADVADSPGTTDAADATDAADDPTAHALRPLPLLRTLYLLEQGAQVRLEGERWVITHGDDTLLDLPLAHIELVLVIGNIGITTPALQAAMRAGIDVHYLNRRGQPYGVLRSADSQHARILRDQVLAASFDFRRLEFAKAFIRAKLANARTLLLRLSRRHAAARDALQQAAQQQREAGWKSKAATSLAQLRGIEGAAAAAYWHAVRQTLAADWGFAARINRHAPDPVNALLSFGYSLLRANLVALLGTQGLNPQLGLYHDDAHGHAALASDLMEEFRALIVDALVLSLIHRRELHRDDFSTENGRARISDAAARRFLHAFEERMQTPIAVRTISHIDGETSNRDPISPRHLMLRQVRDLARALRDPNDPYTPYIGR